MNEKTREYTLQAIRRAIKGMKDAREAEDEGRNIYLSLLHEPKEVIQQAVHKEMDSSLPIVNDFYETMLIVGRSTGDVYVIRDCQRMRKSSEYADRLMSRWKQRNERTRGSPDESGLFYKVCESRSQNTKKRLKASLAVRAFLDKYEHLDLE